MIRPLSSDETREMFGHARTGRLGCVVEGGPYVVPVNYVFHDGDIYIHSLGGRKINALRANPRACFQIEDVKDDLHWKSAIAYGLYEEITDDAERRWAARRLLSRFPQLTPVESVPVHDGQSSVIIFRIRVTGMTGVEEN